MVNIMEFDIKMIWRLNDMGYTKITQSAGHSLKCEGAVGNGYREHLEAVKVMNRVAEILKELGAYVFSFEDTVSKKQNDNLKKIVKKHNASNRQIDLSYHFNASANKSASGVEVLYYNDNMKLLASELSKAIADALGLKNRGAKQNKELYFLRKTSKPSLLIETCFISNVNDMKAYKTNFEAMCVAIAETLAGKRLQKEKPIEVETNCMYRLHTLTWKTKATVEVKQKQMLTLVKVCYIRDESGNYRLITGTFRTKAEAEKIKKLAKEKFNITLHVQEVK